MAEPHNRDRAIDALMALASERAFERITLDEVARRAGLSLAELRDDFDSVADVLAAFARRVDRAVLEASGDDMADEPPRERVFDVLMRRFDELKPHRAALRSIAGAFRRDPLAAAAWNRRAVISMAWMLSAARIDTAGPLGRARAQGLVFAFVRTLRVFLRDEDEGLARTMAELDGQLRRGERRLRQVSRLASLFAGRRRPPRYADDRYAEYPA